MDGARVSAGSSARAYGRTGVEVITAVAPVWIGMDPRADLGVVTTAVGPRWTFTPPVAVTAVRRQFPLGHSKQAFGEHPYVPYDLSF